MDSGADFLAAKWNMVVMGLCELNSFSKTETRNPTSRMFP